MDLVFSSLMIAVHTVLLYLLYYTHVTYKNTFSTATSIYNQKFYSSMENYINMCVWMGKYFDAESCNKESIHLLYER